MNSWTAMKFGFQDQLFMKKSKKKLQGFLFSRCRSKIPVAFQMFFYRRFQKSNNIGRIMSNSVAIWRNVNVASFFAPDDGTYL